MPAVVHSLFDRPPSIRSGEPLTQTLNVQRRSDQMLREQVENINQAQAALQSVLTQLEVAGSEVEEERYRGQAAELEQRCQEMMLVLKIVLKINTELSYARSELQRALSEGRDITLARKRVGWLEGRIEKVLGRERQMSPCPSGQRTSPLGDPDLDMDTSGGSLGPADQSFMSGGDSVTGRDHDRVGLDLAGEGRVSLASQSVASLSRRDVTKPAPLPQILGPDVTPNPERADDQTMGQEGQAVPVVVPDTRASSAASSSSVSTGVSSLTSSSVSSDSRAGTPHEGGTQHGTPHEGGTQLDGTTHEEGTQPGGDGTTHEATFITEAHTQEQEQGPSEEQGEDFEEHVDHVSEADEDQMTTPEVDLDVGDRLMTGDDKKSRTSRVTIRSPEADDEDALASRASTTSPTYWDSEHHRFEYNDYADILLELNPLSYHQMGLAVPGTFVQDVEGDRSLPWRSKSGGSAESVDIHKAALNRLSHKVHKMYVKVREASMLSVDRTKEREYSGPSIRQNLEVRLDTPVDSSSSDISQREATAASSMKLSLKPPSPRPPSRDAVTLPPLATDRRAPTYTAPLVYHPKPLPAPKPLPGARVVRSVEFPPSTVTFSSSVPGRDSPAERIVNQRNLHKETKFTSSLYRAKKKPVPGDDSEEGSRRNTLSNLGSTFKMATSLIRLSRDSSARSDHSDSLTLSQRSERPATGTWKEMKPKSGFLDHSGLKWERVKNIVHSSLTSPNDSERVDAAHHLGALRCGDPSVIYALRERFNNDSSQRVVYEASKALITLGCWEDDIIWKLTHYLKSHNDDIRSDLLATIMDAKNVQFVNKSLPSFPILSSLLSALCEDDDPQDAISFTAAMCLGKLCVVDDNAVAKLRQVMTHATDTRDKAKALELLIQQMNAHDAETVTSVLGQLRQSNVWKHRQQAASHLIQIGPRHIRQNGQTEEVYQLLERRVWDEPNKNVKAEVAKALAALEMYARVCERVEKRLSDPSEEVRAQAVMSIGTLVMSAPRITRVLLEMMELDGSDYVRIMILRTLGMLGVSDKSVLRVLRDKEKGDGPLAREAKKSLSALSVSIREASKESKTRPKK